MTATAIEWAAGFTAHIPGSHSVKHGFAGDTVVSARADGQSWEVSGAGHGLDAR